MRAWGGRFADDPDALAADFTRSVELDQALAADDLTGSIAHVRGLGRAGLLSPAEVEQLVAGLEALQDDVREGRIVWDPSLEDVHMNLESVLAARLGPVGGKLHTGRSRNDQVATDLRLWLRRTTDELDAAIVALEQALVSLAIEHPAAVMPGHTHVQPAQPVLFAHHLLAYVEMLERDRGRFSDGARRANVSPLGSGAIAGAGFAIDRASVAGELGFDGVTRNSIDAVGDRDFAVEFLSAAALTMTHLSRLSEEIAWWSHPRFGFWRAADSFSTGSSMMPNKRNPDPAELVRGRSASVIAALTGMLVLLKGLPAGYQRDLQEDKRPLFETAAILRSSLEVLAGLISTLHVDEARMREAAREGAVTATAVSDLLVELGVPFRTAHHIVGRLVAATEQAGLELHELTEAMVADAFTVTEDVAVRSLLVNPGLAAVTARLQAGADLDAAVARCDVIGGTAPGRVRAELAAAAERLGIER